MYPSASNSPFKIKSTRGQDAREALWSCCDDPEASAGSVLNGRSAAAAQSFYLLLTMVGLTNGRAVKRDKLVKSALIGWLFFL